MCLEQIVNRASAHGYHRMTVSTNGKHETISFFDTHNNPTYSLRLGESPGGFAMILNIRNEKGQIVEIQFKDSYGNLCYNQHHVAICKIEYDNNGLVKDVRNYNTPLIERIKDYLSKDEKGNPKHEVWIDTSEIKAGKDWYLPAIEEVEQFTQLHFHNNYNIERY